MRKIFFVLFILFSPLVLFAVNFSISDEVDIRARKLPFDVVATEGKHSLDRLRNTVDLHISSDKFEFFYRARFNFQNFSQYGDFVTAFLPGSGDAQANFFVHPCRYVSIGVGTDFDLKAGPVSLWDDDIYFASTGSGMWNQEVINGGMIVPGIGIAAKDIIKTYGRGGQPSLGRPATYATSGLLLEIKPIDGLMVALNVPMQSFKNMVLSNGITARDLQMRLAVTYTNSKLFRIGATYVFPFDAGANPWSVYVGTILNFIPGCHPELFFNYISRGFSDGETTTFQFASQTNFGLRLTFLLGRFSFAPEFATAIFNLPEGISSYEEEFLAMKRGAPIFAAVPVAFEITKNSSVGLWISYAMGTLRNEKRHTGNGWDEISDHRIVIRPEGSFKTVVGNFGLRVWMIMDIRSGDLFGDNEGFGMGYRLDFTWKISNK